MVSRSASLGRETRKYRGDRYRSIPLRCFAPLAQIPGVHLISLQKGAGAEQLAEVRDLFPVTDFAGELDEQSGPFMDTAAVMKNLDLVITSDTAVGAPGRRVGGAGVGGACRSFPIGDGCWIVPTAPGIPRCGCSDSGSWGTGKACSMTCGRRCASGLNHREPTV